MIDQRDEYGRVPGEKTIGLFDLVRKETDKLLKSKSTPELKELQEGFIRMEWYEDAARVRDILDRRVDG